SVWLEVNVDRDGKRYNARFERGETVRSVSEVGKSPVGRKSGTEIMFLPDPEIFKETTEFDLETIKARLRQTAFLMAGLKLTLRDERGEEPVEEVFQFERGTAQFVEYLAQRREPVHEGVVHFQGKRDDVEIDVAFAYN